MFSLSTLEMTIYKETEEHRCLPRNLRVVLYSHDTCGLGHTRRNLMIAERLASQPLNAHVLLIAGAQEARLFRTGPGVDMVTLPGLLKTENGGYVARRFEFDLSELIQLRSRVIRTALKNFQPDVFIVDNVPRGAKGELDRSLRFLKHRTSTRIVLGLRDVLDEPAKIRSEWSRADNSLAIHAYFDAVWIYGDEHFFPTAEVLDLDAVIRRKTHYTGYLNPLSAPLNAEPSTDLGFERPATPPYFVCAVGGGQDGLSLARAFSMAAFPDGMTGVIVTGPFMDAEKRRELQAIAASRPDVDLVEFTPDPTRLYAKAHGVVSMAGYNTVVELMALGKKPILAPRVHPRSEQLIRAQRLQMHGLAHVLLPHQITPDTLSHLLASADFTINRHTVKVDMGGLDRICPLIGRLTGRFNSAPSEGGRAPARIAARNHTPQI